MFEGRVWADLDEFWYQDYLFLRVGLVDVS